jgi:hypothetical protein
MRTATVSDQSCAGGDESINQSCWIDVVGGEPCEQGWEAQGQAAQC